MRQLPQDADLAHDLGQSRRVAAKLLLLDELDGDLYDEYRLGSRYQTFVALGPTRGTYLYTARFPAQLHLAELTLTDGIAEDILAKPSLLLASRVVVPTPRSLPWFILTGCRRYSRWGSSFVVVQSLHMVRLRQFLTLPLPLNVDFWGRHQDTVQDFAGFSGRAARWANRRLLL
jgi:hypothetical protein